MSSDSEKEAMARHKLAQEKAWGSGPLTEADVRRIVREELERFTLHAVGCPKRWTQLATCICRNK